MSPFNPINHGLATAAVPVADPPSTATNVAQTSSEPKSSSDGTALSEVLNCVKEAASGNPKEQQPESSQQAPMVPVQQSQQQQCNQQQPKQQQEKNLRDQQQCATNPHNSIETSSVGVQRPPSSASTCSVASFHTGTLSTGSHQHSQHPYSHHYHQVQHHAPHASAPAGVYKMSHSEQIGVPRGQGQHYPPHGHDIGSHAHSSYHHQSGLVRPTGQYPVPHGQIHHGHGNPERPATSRISKQHQQGQYPSHPYHHHQQQHQYHVYQQASAAAAAAVVPVPASGTHSPVPPGVSISQQPLRRLSNNFNVNNITAPHENPNYQSNVRSGGPYHSKPQVPSQHQQPHYTYDQQHMQVSNVPPHPSQDPRSEHLPTMHQGYHNHSHHQHDNVHYGNQPMVQEMHYSYHHSAAHGASAQGHHGSVHNHYRGHHNGGDEYGSVSGGHREVRIPPHHQQQSSHGHHPQPPPQLGQGFQLPKYNASQRVSEPAAKSRSPSESPPPGPPCPTPAPSAQALLRQKLREQESKKIKEQQQQQKGETNNQGNIGNSESSVSLGSINNKGGDLSCRNSIGSLTLNVPNKPPVLGDRGNGNVAAAGITSSTLVVKPGISSTTAPTSGDSVTKPKTTEDPSMDAASILLALGGGPRGSVSGGSENQIPTTKPPIPSSVVQRSLSMDDVSDAGTMLTMQTEAPDLTSDPSSDSIDMETNTGIAVVNKVPETEFPCKVPDRYPTRLSLPYDASKLNTLHCFLRSELLEIFCITKSNKKSPCHSPSSSVGRVGLRCVHCAMVRGSRRDDREDAPMAVFYPKSIAEIYRLVTSWQRCHLRKCRNVPPAARARWQTLRDNDKSRGKTHYWVTSAKQIGLIDCQSRAGGIRFASDFDPRTLPAETMLTSSTSAVKSAAIAAKAQKIVSIAAAAEAAANQQGVSMASTTFISNNDFIPVANITVEQNAQEKEKSQVSETHSATAQNAIAI
mmetsp:Transcript_10086/g.11536  ORF Transcript_10086/g.11536 Transcript_10086/m.11536 type:complete len:968 (-) Transcript_10086:19-2922(-)